MKFKQTRTARWLVACAAALAGACGGGSGGAQPPIVVVPPPVELKPTPRDALDLKLAASCQAYTAYLADAISERLLGQHHYVLTPLIDAAAVAAPPPPAPEAPAFVDFSGTNNQVAGVDEFDLIETDPRGLFYLVNAGTLFVIASDASGDLQELTRVTLTNTGVTTGLTFDAQRQRLVVIVSEFLPASFGPVTPTAADLISILPAEPYTPFADVLFIDVADPAAAVIDGRLRIEGFYSTARRVDGRVHFVGRYEPPIPAELLTDPDFQMLLQSHSEAVISAGDSADLEQQVRNAVSAAVAARPPGDFLPAVTQATGGGDPQPVDLFGCSRVALPAAVILPGMVTVASFDTDGSNPGSLMVVNDSWQVYASEQNIYVSESSGHWVWNELQTQETAIYKIAVGAGAPNYRGAGVVEGWANSPFQFAEHEGFLRVATHRNQFDPATDITIVDNSLFVLEDDGAGRLETVGAVRGFGPGERIFSARFFDDRGFVVTFRQIDPLFAFDLSEPRNPRLTGEVEIPGVSTYLHPLDADHLLTIGRAGTDAGLNNQLQLQIFNVADLAAPVRLHSYEPDVGPDGYSWSVAEYDHLAFTYYAPAQALAVPLAYWNGSGGDSFSGFLVVRPDVASGFTELGRVDHDGLAQDVLCSGADAAGAACVQGYYQSEAQPLRSIFADSGSEIRLYTLSNIALRSHPLSAVTNVLGTAILR